MKTLIQQLRLLPIAAVIAVSFNATSSLAQESAKSLDELLEFVKQGQVNEAKENKVREARFLAEKTSQAKALSAAKKTRTEEERRSTRLEKIFDENKEKITIKRAALNEAKGSLNELFGHINSTAGDMRENFNLSLVSSEYPNRGEFLTDLIEKLKGDALPTISEIERLWFEIQREMIESGRIVQYTTTVATPAGDDIEAEVTRVGSFNIVTNDGQYLKYSDDSLSILPRQPSSAFVDWASDLANADEGYTRFGIDPTGPTGGSLLAAFIDTPTLSERWHQGKQVGYVITTVGIFAMLLAAWRFVVLTKVGRQVNTQLKSSTPSTENPLGRVLAVADDNVSTDTETLELKLNEAVLKEIPALENSLTLLKIIAAVAPLLGLLGTVTGMIITFQAITIFGAGDPKTMASGISSALITTVLGLIVAIPTLLAHTVVNGRAKRVIHVLEEQAAGIIARNAEAK
ncbi:MAG: energy transducer TonB [Actinobacteria bacterium TMED172]|mgnify:FL=1|nr:energy transducer TonB [Cellvibrionales bacterium]OUW32087.1 MAG: energy transducer TonB [Actinobacteria bacterium TMED172]|tara:strand:- start:1521 stop:2900 length:1380 start_codon:yes stop_codon:yes gene_type:complete